MCLEPTTAMLMVSAASAGLSYVGGQQNAKSVTKSQNEALANNYDALNNQQHQTNQKAAQEKSIRTQEGMSERAKLATIAGESGALGLSSDRLINNSFMQEGTDISTIEQNRLNDINGINTKMANSNITAQSTINKAHRKAPTLIESGLQIGSDYLKVKTGSTKAAKAKVSV